MRFIRKAENPKIISMSKAYSVCLIRTTPRGKLHWVDTSTNDVQKARQVVKERASDLLDGPWRIYGYSLLQHQ